VNKAVSLYGAMRHPFRGGCVLVFRIYDILI
jgi:hypothetical protein